MILERWLADLDQLAVMGTALVVAAVLLAPGAALDPPEAMPSASVLVVLVVLGLVCTAARLVVYGMLVAEASRAADNCDRHAPRAGEVPAP
jgi:hypothetical protein